MGGGATPTQAATEGCGSGWRLELAQEVAEQSQKDSKRAMRLKHQGAAQGTRCEQCGQEEQGDSRLRMHPRESTWLSTRPAPHPGQLRAGETGPQSCAQVGGRG